MRLLFLRLLALLARPFVVRRAPAIPRRILVIKPDHLGDVLLATPALVRLRESFPQALIVALVGPWAAVVLAHNPTIDALLTLPFPGFDRSKRSPEQSLTKAQSSQRSADNHAGAGLRAFAPVRALHKLLALIQPYLLLLRYAALLRAGQFDTALLLRDDHWWGAALALLAGIPCRIGHAVPECRP
ncbi:MAG: hypothetical protein MUD01_24705, partial [Chloroflexaceae bacterium]|nr:hypothetical protein [Chloroflexaceae bacterium]